MTSALQGIVVVEWLAIILGAVVFLVAYGAPSRYRDREMAWHLVWATAVAGLQALGLLLASRSLVPIAIADGLAAAIIYWRFWLLLRTRRRS